MNSSAPIAEPARVPTGEAWFACLITGLFMLLFIFGAFHHEFWRDEMQAWLIVRDLHDLGAILEHAHYEGAPPLWSLLLLPLARLTTRPEAMLFMNGLLAGTTVFLIARRAPFGRLAKVLLISNFYFLFEYGIVCRNYLVGILFLIIACIVFCSEKKNPWTFSLALIGASMASVHSLIVAVALALAFWTPTSFSLEHLRDRIHKEAKAIAFLIAGLVLAIVSMLPRADTLYGPARDWNLEWNASRAASVGWAFINAYLPLPRPEGLFWIPPWEVRFPSVAHTLAFSAAITTFLILGISLRKSPRALVLYLAGSLGLTAFLYTKYLGFSRHAGFYFVTFFLTVWLLRSPTINTGFAKRSGFHQWLLVAMLSVQAVTGLWALRKDYDRCFSMGKSVAEFLTARGLDQGFISIGQDWAGAPISGYLNRSLYYPTVNRYGSFTRWDTTRQESVTDEDLILRTIAATTDSTYVMTMDHPFSNDLLEKYNIELMIHLAVSLTPGEDYFVYLGRRPAAIDRLGAAPITK